MTAIGAWETVRVTLEDGIAHRPSVRAGRPLHERLDEGRPG